MFKFKKLSSDDYDDIVDISKDIWEGSDYLPGIFHKWINDSGYFLGIVDVEKEKVIGTSKFSILSDNTGWLEGLRVHKDYRGLKLGRLLSEKIIEIAKEAYSKGIINKIAYSTHISSKESISLMDSLGFKLLQRQILVTKEADAIDKNLDISMFKIEKWNIDYNEFESLDFLKRRSNLLTLAFVFQQPTNKLFEEMKRDNAFVKINGYKGIVKYKGEVNFIVIDECIDSLNAFMNYYLLENSNTSNNLGTPTTCVLEKDTELIEKLRQNHYTAWYDWKPDYLYYVYSL
jgi:GNAT superfamily N-acetyltransferase